MTREACSRARMLALLAAAPLAACGRRLGTTVRVGSKNFTEELILGELYAQMLESHGVPVTRRLDLSGTNIAMAALQRNEIDLYPEYTGTALLDQLHLPADSDAARVYRTVKDAYAAQYDLRWLAPAPMNDSQALAATHATAQRYGMRTLSDVATNAPQLVLGAVPEFLKRDDGLPGLRKRYGGFAFKSVKLIDFGLKYQALAHGDVDVVVAFTTDGMIKALDLVVFDDDKHLFPAYQVAPVVRAATLAAHPQIATQLDRLSPLLTDEVMRDLNLQVDGPQKREPEDVAHDFLQEHHLV
ncbi:MAG TPA: glycine betaine ABC transporter substrate-binding protein [Candidatus Limnocylindria bacterium]|nr:glycine betaine ABC transporter substrate-binding protein [Candidatus Limnocylindria bacterium]